MEGFLFLYLMIAPVMFLFILYFLIRGAVRGGIGDAEADRRWRRRRPYDQQVVDVDTAPTKPS